MHGAGRSSLAPHGALNLQGPTARLGVARTRRASATERTTSPPPARYCAGDGDAVKTDSQAQTPKSVARAPRRFKAPPPRWNADGRAWSGDRSRVRRQLPGPSARAQTNFGMI